VRITYIFVTYPNPKWPLGSKLQMLVSLLGLDLNGAYDHVSHERLIDPTQEKAPKLGHENNLGLSLREDTQR
jgi:hypothetical protein